MKGFGWVKPVGRVLTFPVRAAKKGVETTMQAAILGVVRHLLTAVGGGLVANGTLTQPDFEVVVGAVMALVGVGWSIAKNKRGTA